MSKGYLDRDAEERVGRRKDELRRRGRATVTLSDVVRYLDDVALFFNPDERGPKR